MQLCSVHIRRCICQRYIPFHSWSDATSYSLKGSNFIRIRGKLQVWLKCTKILEGCFVSFFFSTIHTCPIQNICVPRLKEEYQSFKEITLSFTIERTTSYFMILLANFAKFSYLANKAKFALI